MRIDPELVWLDNDKNIKVAYLPGESSSTTHSFGVMLKDMVEKPLQRFNTISEAHMDEYWKAGGDAMRENSMRWQICVGNEEDPLTMEEICRENHPHFCGSQ